MVDSAALAKALSDGVIAGAGIDVFETEPPIPRDHPLFSAPNLVATPHVAFATKEALEKRAVIVFENLAAWLDGAPGKRRLLKRGATEEKRRPAKWPGAAFHIRAWLRPPAVSGAAAAVRKTRTVIYGEINQTSSKPVKATIRLMQLSPSVNFQGKQPMTQRLLLSSSIWPPRHSAWIAS